MVVLVRMKGKDRDLGPVHGLIHYIANGHIGVRKDLCADIGCLEPPGFINTFTGLGLEHPFLIRFHPVPIRLFEGQITAKGVDMKGRS